MILRDPDWIEYITFLPPSADLVPQIELINPDFVLQFGVSDYLQHVEKFQIWLKVSLSTVFFFFSEFSQGENSPSS
jgi:hypothetical protein